MAQELDGIIDRNRGYSLTALAKILGYRETRSVRRDLEDIGVLGTRLGRQRVYVGEAILHALAIRAESVLEGDAPNKPKRSNNRSKKADGES
jgi:hypothetical protein